MIKKNILFMSICAGCIIFFASCGSTPEPEPEPQVIQPEPVVQQEVPVQPPVDVIPEDVSAAVQTERNAAIQAKSRADGIKAAVTEKDAYGEAEALLAQAEDYLNAGEIDAARSTYHSARETFEAVYAQVSQKRVQAAESIRLAALRAHEVESFAFEADAIELPPDEDEYSEEMSL